MHKLTTQASGARVKGDGLSDIEEDRGLVGVLHLFDTEDRSVHLVVDPGQVSDGRSLTDTAELVVDGTVAQADPALVGTEIGHGDAAQVSADSRAAHDGGVAGVRDGGLGLLIELGGGGQGVGLIDLRLGETTDEDQVTVPGGLEHLTWGQLRDVELLVGITDVSVTGDHLVVQNGDESFDTEDVVSKNETLDHVHLCATDLIITVLLIPDSVVIVSKVSKNNVCCVKRALLTCSHRTSCQPWSWHRGGRRSWRDEMKSPSTWGGR